jgi:apolipoprotein N-acyltransferase
MIWMLHADIGGMAQVSTPIGLIVVVIFMFLMAAVMTLALLPLGYFVYVLKKAYPKNSGIILLLLPALVVVCEYLRSILSSIYQYGPGGSIGDYWNFGSFGLAAVQSPLDYMSKYLGLYGLSFIVVAISALLVWIFTRKTHKLPLIGVLVAFILVLGLAGKLDDSHNIKSIESTKHASVQSISSEYYSYQDPMMIEYEDTAKKDLILLTEYSGISESDNSNVFNKYIKNRLSNDGVAIDVRGGSSDKRAGTLQFVNNSGITTDTIIKGLLIPNGEYLPLTTTLLLKLTGNASVVKDFNETRKLQKGETVRVHNTSGLTIGPVACSGILSRQDYRKLTKNGAEVLTNSASLVILGRSNAYFNQSLAMARFHAIANQRTFIQASKSAPSFALDTQGKYIFRSITADSKFTDMTFQTNSNQTFYTRYGETVLYFSVFIVMLSSAILIRKLLF